MRESGKYSIYSGQQIKDSEMYLRYFKELKQMQSNLLGVSFERTEKLKDSKLSKLKEKNILLIK